MKKILQLVVSTVACCSLVIAHAQTTESSQAAPPNYADVLVNSVNVTNPGNAADADLTNYALLQANIGIANSASLKLGWSLPGSPDEQAIVEIQNDGGILSLDILQSITLFLYDHSGNQVGRKSAFDFSDVTVGDDPSKYKIRMRAKAGSADIAAINIVLQGSASVQNRIRVYYAALRSLNCPLLRGDILHAQHNVQNAANAVSPSNTDFATLTPPLVLDDSYLDIAFSTPGADGKSVGFRLGEGNTVLSLSLLQNITLTVYDTNGGVVVSKSGFVLADAQVLPGGRFNLSMTTPKGSYQVGRARITFSGLINVLTTLKVYGINTHPSCTEPSPEAVTNNNSNSLPTGSLKVYPNPFNGYTMLTINEAIKGTAHIVISDKAGNLVEQHEFSGSGTLRLLEKAKPGLYLIKVISGNSIETQKVIKF